MFCNQYTWRTRFNCETQNLELTLQEKRLVFKKTTYLELFLAVANFQTNINTPKFNVA